MSTSNTYSSSSMGWIVGISVTVVVIMMLVAAYVFLRKKSANTSFQPATSVNGGGVLNNGSNPVPRTNVNFNSGRGANVT